MKNFSEKVIELDNASFEIITPKTVSSSDIYGVRVCMLKSIADDGKVVVDYPNDNQGPAIARSVIELTSENINMNALVVYEKNDTKLPIVVGLIRDRTATFENRIALKRNTANDIIIDGNRVVFDADKEIELRCGKSSLILKKDGKIVIKGIEIVSRSSGLHKIKGATVRIN